MGIALLMLPLVPGVGKEFNGSRIWINVGSMSFQPGEVAKIVLAIFFASYLVEKRGLLAVSSHPLGPIPLPDPKHPGPVLPAGGASLVVMISPNGPRDSLAVLPLFLALLLVATRRACHPPRPRSVGGGNKDGGAALWGARTGLAVRALSGHTGVVLVARFSPDGSTVVTASRDHSARLWDVRSGTQLATFDEHTGDVWDAAFSPTGNMLVTASRDGSARLWLTNSGSRAKLIVAHGAGIRAVAFSPDGQRILTASADRTAQIRDTTTGAQLSVLSGHGEGIRSAAFSSDGRLVATAGEDLTIRIWDASTGKELSKFSDGAEVT